MSAQRLTDPAVEPVSLSELRDWLRVDSGVEDAILSNLIVTARLALEGHTRRAFISQAWTFTYLSCGPGGLLRLPLGPLLGVSAVRRRDADGAVTNMPAASYTLEADDQRPAIRLRETAISGGATHYELDVVIGYGEAPGDVPAPLRQAILMLATHWHARRGDHAETGLTIPRAITALVAPYRRARLA